MLQVKRELCYFEYRHFLFEVMKEEKEVKVLIHCKQIIVYSLVCGSISASRIHVFPSLFADKKWKICLQFYKRFVL